MVLEDTVPASWDHYLSSGHRINTEFNQIHKTWVPPTGPNPDLWEPPPGPGLA